MRTSQRECTANLFFITRVIVRHVKSKDWTQEKIDANHPVSFELTQKGIMVVSIIVFLFGSVFFLPGLYLTVKHRIFLFTSEEVQLQVIRNHSFNSAVGNRSSVMYIPIFEFTTEDGQTLRYASDYATGNKFHKEGDRVLGSYSPKTKEMYSYELSQSKQIFGLLFLGIGGLIVYSMFLCYVMRQWALKQI